MCDLPFREDKTNKDWENPVEGRQLSAGGVQATKPLCSETTTRKFSTHNAEVCHPPEGERGSI